MTLDTPETVPPTPTTEPITAPAKKSPVAGNIVFVVSSLVSTIACCLCAVAGAAISPSALTALQKYRAIQRGVSIITLNDGEVERSATATAQADAFNDLNGSRQFGDSFDVAASFWMSGTYDNDYSKTDYSIEGGKYIWNVNAHQGLVIHLQFPTAYLADFYTSAEFRVYSNAEGAQYGLVFRDNHKDYYVFLITDNREFSVMMFKDGVWQVLLEPVATSNLVSDEVNRLTVVGEGSHFDFYINNVHVADLEDTSLSVGQVGLAAGLQHANDTGTFEFDNLEVRILNPAEDFETPELAPTRTPTASP
jgi:hypothetical protein